MGQEPAFDATTQPIAPEARQPARRGAAHEEPAAAAAPQKPFRNVPGREPQETVEVEDEWILLDAGRHVRHQSIFLEGGVWTDRLVGGVWYGLPVAHYGVLPHVNDAIVLDMGADYTWLHDYGQSTHALWLAVGPRWDFYLTRAWTVYASFHLGLMLTLKTNRLEGPNLFQPGVGMGAFYRLHDGIRLGMDFGYPQGFRVGFKFDLDG